ncbi:MAG: GNAT family N-acetyltransferase [candidate division Zixibacteria bacterium]|nr:GNAT family N-acetyltransferase [candidate division Zixibacteria bacterium]
MLDNSFEIRPVTESDIGAVLDIYCQSEDFLALGPKPKASMAMVLRDMETSRNENGLFCGIYASSGKLIGIVDYVPRDFNGMAHVAFISLLMIIPPLRNRGIGTRIVNLVESTIRATGQVSEIRTAVQLNNPAALRFWKRNKYRVFGNPELRLDQTVISYLRKELSDSD